MDIKKLTERAMEIRKKYMELEKLTHGRSWTRSEVALGFIGDVGNLTKIVMAKEGIREMENADNEIKYELADCLWSILVLAKEYGVDLEDAFLGVMEHIEKKIGGKKPVIRKNNFS
jgi:NTP pyrophosphatase (non-canonical NTP hydrolase)